MFALVLYCKYLIREYVHSLPIQCFYTAVENFQIFGILLITKRLVDKPPDGHFDERGSVFLPCFACLSTAFSNS